MKIKASYTIITLILILFLIAITFIWISGNYRKQNSYNNAILEISRGNSSNIFYQDKINDEIEFLVLKNEKSLELVRLYKDNSDFCQYKTVYSLENKDSIINWREQSEPVSMDGVFQKNHYIVGNGAYDEIKLNWDEIPKGVSFSTYQVDNFFVVKLTYTETEDKNENFITDYKWLENVSF